MTPSSFKALVLDQAGNGTVARIKDLSPKELPQEKVLVRVEYSCLNYKDALAVTGKGKIARTFPLVPGIDLAGEVVESASGDYSPGQKVLLTGWSVGEKYWGGFSQYARVRPGWLVPMPEGLDAKSAMALGTAGFTAMLCVLALEQAGIAPEQKLPVAVSGATGGVGGYAVAILSRLGYQVAAITGSPQHEAYLRRLGASELVSRGEMQQPPRPLEKQRWAAAVDTVGGVILARLLAETAYDGAVAACGLAGSADLPASVMPFILRGVRLWGVDSVMAPFARRQRAWHRLAQIIPAELLAEAAQTAGLQDIPRLSGELLAGKIRGRIILDPNQP